MPQDVIGESQTWMLPPDHRAQGVQVEPRHLRERDDGLVGGIDLAIGRVLAERKRVEERLNEFAVIVEQAMKGQGLGRHLMERLYEWGRAVAVGEVAGQILADNRPMLAFVRSLGFSLRRSPEEDEVMEARLAL